MFSPLRGRGASDRSETRGRVERGELRRPDRMAATDILFTSRGASLRGRGASDRSETRGCEQRTDASDRSENRSETRRFRQFGN